MNDKYLASSRPCQQTEADIRAIVQAATADHDPIADSTPSGLSSGTNYM